ncbi:MAG TPA: hypothetical protein DHM44_10710 [Flexistipes sinusarabici]|uniref:DUF86 domain-containing protein n=1 Tax=Flexistipes sinusarabici TaxID=2352 RepID=A0A3D5QE63_FLESI|nr:hypothetical protein [Flexistipes sinusarabici]
MIIIYAFKLKISADIKNNSEHIPWKQTVGLRNKVIHEYFGVDESIIFSNLPKFLHLCYLTILYLNNGISQMEISKY